MAKNFDADLLGVVEDVGNLDGRVINADHITAIKIAQLQIFLLPLTERKNILCVLPRWLQEAVISFESAAS